MQSVLVLMLKTKEVINILPHCYLIFPIQVLLCNILNIKTWVFEIAHASSEAYSYFLFMLIKQIIRHLGPDLNTRYFVSLITLW